MGRKSISQERKQQITEALYEVAKSEGLENASIAKVAKHMGIHPSLIIHYFNTREELILELIDFNLERYRHIYDPLPEEEGEPLSNLLATIDKLFSRTWNSLYDDGVYYSCYALTFRDERIRDRYRELHDFLHEMLAKAIQRCIDTGEVEVSNARQLAEVIFALVDGGYYYLGMVDNREQYVRRMHAYKQQALQLLCITRSETVADNF